MNDLYREILVKQKKKASASLIRAGMIAAIVVFALGGLFMNPVFLFPAVGIGIAAYFIFGRLDKEFEYLYVNGDFDIDVIYNMQKRKRAGSYDVDNLIVFAPENSHELDSYRNKQGITVQDYTSGYDNRKIWCGVYNVDKGEAMVRLELEDETVVRDLRRYAPRKVFES